MIPRRFEGQTVVCIGSGPSLTNDQIEQIEYAYIPTIAINNSFQLAPWCDLVFACDIRWWYQYYQKVIDTCPHADFWTIKGVGDHFYKKTKALGPRLNEVGYVTISGLGTNDKVRHGGNSGYIAVNLAYLMGASKIVLVGYDHKHSNGKSHWHGDHDKKYFPKNAEEDGMDRWLKNFRKLAIDLDRNGIELVNCSLDTAITSCRQGHLLEELR